MHFLYPETLFLVLLLLPLFFIKKKKRSLEVSRKIIVNSTSARYKELFLALAFVFALIALARPVSHEEILKLEQKEKTVAIAIDISKSMTAKDAYPSRLAFAKQKIKEFIDKFEGKVALLAFSNNTYLVSPPTDDKGTLLYLLESLSTDYVSIQGTRFDLLIETAKEMKFQDLLVITDGGDNLHDFDLGKMRLFSLTVGSNQGAPIGEKGNLLTQKGKVVIVKRNDDIISKSSFGLVATTGSEDIDRLIDQKFQTSKGKESLKMYDELFVIPLSLALFFLFLGYFSLPSKSAALLLVLALFPSESQAGLLDYQQMQKANQLVQEKKYDEAIEAYRKVDTLRSHYNIATIQSMEKKYDEALKSYALIKTDEKKIKEKIFFNKGNIFYNQKKWDDAINEYNQTLQLNPDHTKAKEFMEMAQKQKQKQEEEKKKQQEKNQDGESKENQNQQSNSRQNSKNQKQQKSSQGENKDQKEKQKQEEEKKKQQEKNQDGESKENQNQQSNSRQNSKNQKQQKSSQGENKDQKEKQNSSSKQQNKKSSDQKQQNEQNQDHLDQKSKSDKKGQSQPKPDSQNREKKGDASEQKSKKNSQEASPNRPQISENSLNKKPQTIKVGQRDEDLKELDKVPAYTIPIQMNQPNYEGEKNNAW